jgi:hypothetical protein
MIFVFFYGKMLKIKNILFYSILLISCSARIRSHVLFTLKKSNKLFLISLYESFSLKIQNFKVSKFLYFHILKVFIFSKFLYFHILKVFIFSKFLYFHILKVFIFSKFQSFYKWMDIIMI